MKPVRKAFLALLLALVCLTPHGYAQDTASHPVDGRMQRLSVLSQRDEAIGELAYHTATVQRRGCMPVSIVNALIASFGVTETPLLKPDMMFLLKMISFLKKYSFSSQFKLAAPVSSAIDPAKLFP